MVRELGFLGDGSSEIGMTHAECHALIEHEAFALPQTLLGRHFL